MQVSHPGAAFSGLFDPGVQVRGTYCTSSQSFLLSCLLLLYLFVSFFVCLVRLTTFAFLTGHLPIFYPSFSRTTAHTVYCVSSSCRLCCPPPHWLSLSFDVSLTLRLIFLFPFLSPSLHLLLFFLSPPRVTLDPSKRQSSNKSMSGCTLPQGTKTVSKSSFPMFSGCFCLPDCLPARRPPVIPSAPHPLSVAGWSLVVQTLSEAKLLYRQEFTHLQRVSTWSLKSSVLTEERAVKKSDIMVDFLLMVDSVNWISGACLQVMKRAAAKVLNWTSVGDTARFRLNLGFKHQTCSEHKT